MKTLGETPGTGSWREHVAAARLYVPALGVVCLVPLSFYNYLLFHTVVELLSIIVACGVFVIAWNAYPFSRNRFLLFIGTGLLWVSALDLYHTLAYKGMNILPGVASANTPTQFWIGTRYLHAMILLAAPLFLTWPLRRWQAMLGLFLAALAVFASIESGHFPDAFIEDRGLTPFKVYSEYIVIALMAGSLWFLWRRRAGLDERILALVAASTVLLMIGELAFTYYVSVYGLSNLAGHLFKGVAYWLIYVALVDRALAQPFRIMALGASTYDAIPDATILVDREGTVREVNDAARREAGMAGNTAVGRDCHVLFHPADLTRGECPACRLIRDGIPTPSLELEDRRNGRWTEISLAPVSRGEEVSGMVHVSRDITLRKAASELVRREQELLRSVLETLPVGVWITDAEGKIVRGNPAGQSIWGGARQVGVKWYGEYKGWWSDNGKRIEAEEWALSRAVRRGETSLGELIDIECLDGTRKTILNSAVPLRDDAGNITGAIVVNQDVTGRRQAEKEKERLLADLHERLKELRCLYAISELLEGRESGLEEILARIVELLPPAFQYPDIACASIGFAGRELKTANFRETPWQLSADLMVRGSSLGHLRVGYLEERPRLAEGPFLNEERQLIDAVVERIGKVIERLQAEDALRESERRYSQVGAAVQDGIIVIDETGCITDWNAAAERLFGYGAAEAVGRNLHRMLAPARYRDDYERGLAKFASNGQGAVIGKTLELAALHRDGSEFPIELSIAAFKWRGRWHAVGSVRDITDRKLAETALRHASAYNRSLIEASPDPLVTIGAEGKITDVNAATEAVTGCPRDALVGQDFSGFFTDPDKARAGYAQAFREGGVRDYPLEIRHRDGHATPVLYNASVYRDESGAVAGVFAAARDITVLKQHEQALRKLNRALTTLSRCNEALVHASDEQALLEAMCRTIVEVGGYPLAWVGYAENDPIRTVRPMAHAGHSDAYIEHLKVSWADTPLGHGPVGKAIRLGVPQKVDDVATDPDFDPWRADALRLGYASVLALPLQSGNMHRMGALVIYGAQAHAFDEQEIALLAELANDLSYGIATQREHLERQQSRERLERSLENTIQAIALALEKRDPYTAGHQRRVAELSVAIGRKLGLEDRALKGLGLAASIHDIGKIYIPAEILSRPGRLSAIEFELIKTHPQIGYEIVQGIDFPWPVADMILHHHERLDGSGYPNGLKGNAIGIDARILAVADVVEAMASHRPYRAARGMDAALDEIASKRGIHFDEQVVDACVELIRGGDFAWGGD